MAKPGGPRDPAATWSPSPLLGRVLGAGAVGSMLLLLIGIVLALADGRRGGTTYTPGTLLRMLGNGHTTGVLGLGLILLIATPVAREVVALVLFARRREYSFVLAASVVLALIVVSLIVGAR